MLPDHLKDKEALIYADKGTGPRSVRHLRTALQSCLPADRVGTVTAAEIFAGGLTSVCKVLCFPGGADIFFVKSLKFGGTDIIVEWVRAGGVYIGICAGAYFACDRCEFYPDDAEEIIEDRSLKFFPGAAIGPLIPGFQARTERGSSAVPVQIDPSLTGGTGSLELSLYFNGGPHFVMPTEKHPGITPLMLLRDGRVVGVRCEVGKGLAMLLGAHVEYDPFDDPKTKSDPDLQPHVAALLRDDARRSQVMQNIIFAALGRRSRLGKL